VSRGARRRRGAVLLALALACGGMAASEVQDRESRVEARIGPLVPVVVARADLRTGASLSAGRLAVRRVPARFVPPDALAATEEAAGARLAVPLAAGAYVTGAALARDGGEGAAGSSPGPGERAVDVAVAGGADLTGAEPGARVDVLITTDGGEGRGRSYLALEDVELLGARPGEGADAGGAGAGAAAHATAIATLRVTLREAVLLTAAQSFAREIRLLVRPPGERRGGRGVAVDAAAL
jgi:pilus assembly protein CpaB